MAKKRYIPHAMLFFNLVPRVFNLRSSRGLRIGDESPWKTRLIVLLFRCCCGRLNENHPPEAKTQILKAEVTWDVKDHTVKEPTNAFGELKFTGAGQTSRAKV